MNERFYTSLQIREAFHLEFLRWFGLKTESSRYCLKGGVNLRLFCRSIRYSEGMDIDSTKIRVDSLQKIVMGILSDRRFTDSLQFLGIDKIILPDMMKAKQTETTQRFKVHLLTLPGEDLFTKIEFSRRRMKGHAVVEQVPSLVLRSYKMGPLLVIHYDVTSAVVQKIHALAQRTVLQARDIFDLFVLSSQYVGEQKEKLSISKTVFKTAYDNIFLVEYLQFRDSVVAYLGADDQKAYSSSSAWDEIKLKTANFLEEFKNETG